VAAVAAAPRPRRAVVAVAAAPLPRRAVVEILRSGIEAAVPRSAAAAPRSRGRATTVPLCGQAAASPGPPRRRHFQGRRANDVPRCASSDGDTRGVRFERRHGRCEVRAATIAHDILRSGAVRAARMTTYICAYVVDDVLRRLPPSIFNFLLLCFIPTTCIIYAKNCTILFLNTKFVYQFDACVFFACTLKRQFLNLCCL
jgi:hypothetical protein